MKKERNTITVKEAAKSLGVSEMTVYRMLKAGKLNAVKRLVNRHHQSFIRVDQKWDNAISKKQNKTAKEHYTALIESYEKAAKESASAAAEASIKAEDHATNAENQAIVTKDYAIKAEAACAGAAANANYARIQAKEAKSASEDAKRYYLATKAFAEDTIKYRVEAAESASKAKEEARSAMRCVVWCFCAAVLSLLFAIAHIIL